MGCGSSRRVRPINSAAQKTKILSSRQEAPSKLIGGDGSQDIIDSFNFIINGVSTFRCPPGSVPIVCLSYDCIPVLSSNLTIDGNSTDITLPIIAASVYSMGRLMCFGHMQMLMNKCFAFDDTATLFHNSLVWLAARQSLLTPVYGLNIDSEYKSEIKSSLHGQGFQIKYGSFDEKFSSYNVIIIQSNLVLTDEQEKILLEYTEKGGGIACFYVQHKDGDVAVSNQIPMNNFLIRFGLSYTYCALCDEDAPTQTVDTTNFENVRKRNMDALVSSFKHLMDKPKINPNILDDLVTTLRYYILVCNHSYDKSIARLYKYGWEILRMTNYRTEDNLLCPSVVHSMIIVLMEDIMPKMPLKMIEASPDIDIFPGMYLNPKIGDFTLDLMIVNDTLLSTGLWLPAGEKSQIVCENPIPGVSIQIGAQTESLLIKNGPYKRWPIIAYATPLGTTTKLVSQFGGILYLIASGIPQEMDNTKLKIRCQHFCKYTRAVHSKPEVYTNSKDFGAPWGELISKSIIYTVPKYVFERIDNFNEHFTYVESFVSSIAKLMEYEINRQYRVVFDPETLSETNENRYPLVTNLDDLDDIFFCRDTPTPALYRHLQSLALVSIRDGCFDETSEKAIAAFVANTVLIDMFPFYDPLIDPIVEMPQMFKILWIIDTKINSSAVRTMIQNSQKPDAPTFDVPEDKWISLVRTLCNQGRYNFSAYFEKIRPIPLNIAHNLEGFPPPPPLESLE